MASISAGLLMSAPWYPTLVIAKTVEHDVRALARQRLCNPQADAAGGAGNEGGFAFQHDVISN